MFQTMASLKGLAMRRYSDMKQVSHHDVGDGVLRKFTVCHVKYDIRSIECKYTLISVLLATRYEV
jgi:hypothetical protein